MAGVRVRIAPSPTGSPHVGTAYMGLFNYAFAKSQGGSFVLRIEDTDRARSRKSYEQAIFDALAWIGLTWDEGPDVGGPFGPYRQSERMELYRKYADELLEKDLAYRCFCTPERLANMRARQRAEKAKGGYDGHCRRLDGKDVQNKLKNGESYVVRLKVPEKGECVFKDRFRGEVTYGFDTIDDQVLLKSDGFPTYHLANVVDDHLMGITHVIRGEEWIASTPKHILLYESLGWNVPEFIHLPLLLNPDGSKLSKRKNPTSIFYYRDAGYLPEALLNYLGLMSYSRPDQQEKFTLAEFVSDFDIDRMKLGGSIFDLKKLSWLNSRYIREDHTPEKLWERLESWRINGAYIRQMIPMMQNRLKTLGDFIPAVAFMFAAELEYDQEILKSGKNAGEDIPAVLQTVLFEMERMEIWSARELEKRMHRVAAFWEKPIRSITGILFPAVMGKRVGPPLFESMAILGIDITRRRITNALALTGGIGKKKLKKLEKTYLDWTPEPPTEEKTDNKGGDHE